MHSSAYLIFPRDRQTTMSAIIGLVATLAPTLVLTFNDAFLALALRYMAALLLWPLLQKPRSVATGEPPGR